MGGTLSRGTLDVIYILFPFVLSTGLIIMIVICWWKCKILFGRRCPGKTRRDELEEPDFGHLINIQEYAENQVGTTIVYADSPGSSCPHPYVYFSDGRITRIVPLTPSPTYSYGMMPLGDHSHSSCPSALLCNNLPRTGNNNHQLRCPNGQSHHTKESTSARNGPSTSVTLDVKSDDADVSKNSPVSEETCTSNIISCQIDLERKPMDEGESGDIESQS